MTDDEYRAETIRAALDGDADAGLEALRLCRSGLDHNNLHADLSFYLAQRITELLEDVPPKIALCIHSGRGRPKAQFPEWQQRLGAFAAVLTQRGYKANKIATAMCVERAKVEPGKNMDASDAHKIRKVWKPMCAINPTHWEREASANLKERAESERLLSLAGPYRKQLSKYPPL